MRKRFRLLTAAILVAGAACGREPPTPATTPVPAASPPEATPPPQAPVVAETNAARRSVEQLVAEAIQEKTGDKAEVEIEGNQLRVQTEKGAVHIASGADVAWPAGFPADITRYAGATLTQVIATPGSLHVMLTSTDAQDQVVSFYRSQLAGTGWGTEMEMSNAGNDMISAVKGPQRLTLLATRQDGATLVSLTVTTP